MFNLLGKEYEYRTDYHAKETDKKQKIYYYIQNMWLIASIL